MLATIADLLLPTKAMQKYVRMVMGMAIIAAMLQPIVPLLKGDWADKVANATWLETQSTPAVQLSDSATTELTHVIHREQLQDANGFADPMLTRLISQQFHVPILSVSMNGSLLNSKSITIHVTVGAVATSTWEAIQAYVAKALGLNVGQVTVSSQNGGG